MVLGSRLTMSFKDLSCQTGREEISFILIIVLKKFGEESVL